MKTFQGFIIWGNGTKYIEEILSIIREYPNIEIKKIFKKQNVDIKKFIKKVYELDDYSREHIEEKTKYLLSCPNELYLIIVFDKDTIYKEKPNKNKYLYNETLIKWKVRLMFNPRTKVVFTDNLLTKENLEKAAIQKFWIPEVTHNHVIHCTDREEEIAHILKIFNHDLYKSKDYFLKKTPTNLKVLLVHIGEILINTCVENEIPVENSPHYKYLMGEKENYRKYIMKYLGTIIKDDHLPGKYDELIKNFNYGKIINNIPSYIIVRNAKNHKNRYVVEDGVHRLAILKKQNKELIKVYFENL